MRAERGSDGRVIVHARWLLPIVVLGLVAGCSAADDDSAPTMPRISSNVLVTMAPTTTTTIPTSYTIQEGDTLSAIAQRFHVDIDDLAAANGITDPDDIEAGQTLRLPAPPATTTTTTSP